MIRIFGKHWYCLVCVRWKALQREISSLHSWRMHDFPLFFFFICSTLLIFILILIFKWWYRVWVGQRWMEMVKIWVRCLLMISPFSLPLFLELQIKRLFTFVFQIFVLKIDIDSVGSGSIFECWIDKSKYLNYKYRY